jgi:hypothetical protein
MENKGKRGRVAAIVGGLLATAVVMGLGAGDAEAQYRRYRPAAYGDAQVEAELAAKVAQLNYLVAQERARNNAFWAAREREQLRRLRPGQIRAAIPINGYVTPAERATQQMLNGYAISSARAICEANRAATPYNPYRPGTLNDGWYDTMTGPRQRSCY